MGFILGISASAVFLWLFVIVSKKKDNVKKYKTKAIIDKVIYSDTGNVRYYIKFNKDNREIKGQTIYYSKTDRKYNEGDNAEIYYHYAKNNKIMAEIIDDDLVPCSNSLKNGKYILLFLSVFFFVVSMITLFK